MIREILDDWARHRPSGSRVMFALVVYRFGRWAKGLRFWPLRKLFGLIYVIIQPPSSILGGLYLHRDTQVGEAPHFIHGGNIQINPNAIIGNRVGIMHGVTLGNNGKDDKLPTVGDDTFLGCNCSVLGGVTVGDRSIVAGNSLVISDVPPDSTAIGVPAKMMPMELFEKLGS